MTKKSVFCVFRPTDEANCHRCARCGRELVTQNPPEKCYAPCLIDGPPLIEMALNFAKAAFGQAPLVFKGLLKGEGAEAFRTQAEIEQIAAICKACPLFEGERCTHEHCGCPISTERNAWWNKIAWRSQHCPDTPPRW